MTKPNTIPVTWNELHRQARALAGRIRNRGVWTRVIGIARGGLVPAAILAKELDIRVVESISVASYEGRVRGEVKILKRPDGGDGADTIVVDDVADSGETIRVVRTLLPRAFYVAVYATPAGKPVVDAFAVEIDQESWLEFPWEAAP
ncbi:MAG: xanthine phosphoribosyltransferase [Alphaproteobacteria bacterium]